MAFKAQASKTVDCSTVLLKALVPEMDRLCKAEILTTRQNGRTSLKKK